MVHPRLPPALADRLIERIAGCLRAEHLAVARPEALDRVLIEQRFGRWKQLQRLGGAKTALVGGIEAANTLDLVAEEVDAQPRVLAGGEKVDEAAAHREFALIGDGIDAVEPVGDEQFGKRVAIDPLPRCERGRELADAEGREGALGDRGARGRGRSALPRIDGRARLWGGQSQGGRRGTTRSGAKKGAASATACIAVSSVAT